MCTVLRKEDRQLPHHRLPPHPAGFAETSSVGLFPGPKDSRTHPPYRSQVPKGLEGSRASVHDSH